MDNLLPTDDELMCREGLLLKLFDKFSVDEGSDPELGDFGSSDDTVEDNSGSGSSFSEASSIESASDSSSVIENIKQQIQPVIENRVNAWPKKGVHLQLKTVDPSVTVDEWLKANNEFTTTTKKYKKTVVNENNKTVITTTKQKKTTTKKTSFHSFMPRFLQSADGSDHKKAIEDKVTSNETTKRTVNHTDKEKKLKEQKKKKKFNETDTTATSPVVNSGHYSLRNKNRNGVKAKHTSDIVQQPAEPKQEHKKQSSLKVNKKPKKLKPGDSNSEKKSSDRDYPILPIDNSTKRFLRSRNKENKVNQTQESEGATRKQSTTHKTQKKPEKSKPVKLTEKISSSTVPASQNRTRSNDPSRSPLKEKVMNILPRQTEKASERILKDNKIKNLTVTLGKLPTTRVNTRQSARRNNALSTSNEMNSQLVCNNDETIGTNNTEVMNSLLNPLRRNNLMKKSKRQIVIHSPSSDTILGTKIDDTFMLVTKNDYQKRIHSKYLRNTDRSIMNNSIIPINRRIVFKPPMAIMEDNSGSEAEDELMTAYTNTGHIFQTEV